MTATTLFNRHEAIAQMNTWGQEGRPFLFIISYDLQSSYLKPLTEIPASELKYNFNGVCNEPKSKHKNLLLLSGSLNLSHSNVTGNHSTSYTAICMQATAF